MQSKVQEPDLFSMPPRHNKTDTSKAAAASMVPHASRIQLRILQHIEWRSGGCTYDELVVDLSMEKPTVAARLNELQAAGLIEPSDRRKTRSGRTARVYVATANGARVAKGSDYV